MPPTDPYVALIGFPARDTKRFPDGTVVESLGGVLFTALALAALGRRHGFSVVPVCNLGRDIAREAERLLAEAGCFMEGVCVVDAPTQHSFITFTDANERWERVEGVLPSLPFERIAPWLTARAFAVNFITGVETDLATFRRLREQYRGPIIIDYHTLGLATLPDGRREPRRRPDWAAWLEVPTVVQMNRDEAEAVAGHELPDAEACAVFARQVLRLGPQAAVITRAEEGAVGAERTPEGFVTYCLPAESPEEIVDTVGCGDVFCAALAAGWTVWGRLEPALGLALRAAGYHCSYAGLESLSRLAHLEDMRELSSAHP